MKRSQFSTQRARAVVGLAVGLAVGSTAVGFASTADDIASDVDRTKSYFEVNEAGQTYGSGDTPIGVDQPDLIRAEGRGGTVGYVRAEDLEGPQPSSPEEAAAMPDATEPRSIPLYAVDGVTVIDEFVVQPSVDPTAD